MQFLPVDRMKARIAVDRSESDVAAYWALMYYGELLTKSVVAGMVASLADDKERQRYGFLYRLVRSSGVGDWAENLRTLCTGPSEHLMDEGALEERRQLTEHVGDSLWQYEAVRSMHECARLVAPDHTALGRKAPLLHWFDDFAIVRNKTRGHGAKRIGELAVMLGSLARSMDLVADNLCLFQREWAFLHRNLSSKYRVTPCAASTRGFDELKSRSDITLRDGVYVLFRERRFVELIHSDADVTDFLFPNGSFSSGKYELISYSSGSAVQTDATPYMLPPERLPSSQTHGSTGLGAVHRMLTNIPAPPASYVCRPELEAQLRDQLELTHHPIVTLSGYGGIGKTSLALTVIHNMAAEDGQFALCIWFSARDIDLLPEGAKRVTPQGLTLKDFARTYAELVGGAEIREKGFSAVTHFAQALAQPGPLGRTLFVFDNFETVVNPGEVYAFIDNSVRSPNKVLITTRIRNEFHADFPLTVGGMTESESLELIRQTAAFLGISDLLTQDWCKELIEESSGHPYVMKILLGEVARMGHLGRPKRIAATRDKILVALFERTYDALTPAAQRVFLTLASWDSSVPEIGLEAVLLRDSAERIGVTQAIDELVQASLAIRTIGGDGMSCLELPLAAGLFGKRKLDCSQWSAAVAVDRQLLIAFGASRSADDNSGIGPRIERFFRSIAERAAVDAGVLGSLTPVLEYISSAYPPGWLLLARLYEESSAAQEAERVKTYLRRYLENPDDPARVSRVWQNLSRVCEQSGDLMGELHALAKMCQVDGLPLQAMSNAANRFNARWRDLFSAQDLSVGSEEARLMARELADALATRWDNLEATDLSRLGWLYIHGGDSRRASEAVEQGLRIDPENEYCQRLYFNLRARQSG